MTWRTLPSAGALLLFAALGLPGARGDQQASKPAAQGPQVMTVVGTVVDTHCLLTANLKGPEHQECAVTCAKAGVPLAILAEDGTLYWPVVAKMPSRGQNDKLEQWAEKKVAVKGKVFDRNGTKGIEIETISAAK